MTYTSCLSLSMEKAKKSELEGKPNATYMPQAPQRKSGGCLRGEKPLFFSESPGIGAHNQLPDRGRGS